MAVYDLIEEHITDILYLKSSAPVLFIVYEVNDVIISVYYKFL